MDQEIAATLVDTLKRHSWIIPPNREIFMKVLTSTEVPDSSRFYEKLPDNEQLLKETDRYHKLSLRMVLRNRNAKDYRLSPLKKIWEDWTSTLGIYSSEVLSRNLRANSDLIDMMAASEHPFSLLGKQKTYDYSNAREDLFRATRPVLVIPGQSDIIAILDWENANIIYEKNVHTPFPKRIRPQEYYKAC